MARKSGRGLFLGKEDFIPLERVDILDDLKRLVDVHRITDFSLSDKVVPTIELRRTEDEVVGAVGSDQAGGGAGFTTAQLFAESSATPTGIIARPLSLVVSVTATDVVLIGYLPFSGGAVLTTSADPRRPVADLVGTGLHVDNTTALMLNANIIWRFRLLAGTSLVLPESFLQRLASVAGQCLTIQPLAQATGLTVGVSWRVESGRLTRRQG